MSDSKTIRVLPRLPAEAYEPGPDEVCISITNPRQSPACLSSQWHAVLRLGFHDTDLPWGNFVTMNRDHARQILEFGRCHRNRAITVHCEYGASRSVAVGLFLAVWLKRQLLLPEPILVPNQLIIRQLRVAGLARQLRGVDVQLLRTALLGPGFLCWEVVSSAIAKTYIA